MMKDQGGKRAVPGGLVRDGAELEGRAVDRDRHRASLLRRRRCGEQHADEKKERPTANADVQETHHAEDTRRCRRRVRHLVKRKEAPGCDASTLSELRAIARV